MLDISIIINKVINSADSLLARDGLRFSRTVGTGIARYIFTYFRPLSIVAKSGLERTSKRPSPGKAQALRIVSDTLLIFWPVSGLAQIAPNSPAARNPMPITHSLGTVIASKEYGRQICPGRLVVQPHGHQHHWLDNPKAILEAPTKKA